MAIALGASDIQAALVTVDDGLAHPKAQTSTFHALRREKGFEDFGEHFPRHATSSVRDGQQNTFFARAPTRRFSRTKYEPSRPWRRVDGVSDEVAKNLPDISLEHLDGSVRPVQSFHNDSGVLNLSFQK
jgi:hypothetical protein